MMYGTPPAGVGVQPAGEWPPRQPAILPNAQPFLPLAPKIVPMDEKQFGELMDEIRTTRQAVEKYHKEVEGMSKLTVALMRSLLAWDDRIANLCKFCEPLAKMAEASLKRKPRKKTRGRET